MKTLDRNALAEAIKLLPEADLIFLNRLIVERCKLIRQAQSLSLIAKFSRGDFVRFQAADGRTILGVITRLNRKTVTIATGDGHEIWNVSPNILTRVERPDFLNKGLLTE